MLPRPPGSSAGAAGVLQMAAAAPPANGSMPYTQQPRGRGRGSAAPAAAAPAVPPPKAQPTKPLGEALRSLLAASAEDPLACVQSGLQAQSYLWTYVAPTFPGGVKEVVPSSQQEADMLHAVALHLVKSGVAPKDIVVAAPSRHQHELLVREFRACPIASQVPQVLLMTFTGERPAFRWLLVSSVSPDVLRYPQSEPALSRMLLAGAEQRAGVIFTSSTQFVREATKDAQAGSWRTGWRDIVTTLQDTAFRVSGSDASIASSASPYLPLCCPRHPSVREDAEEGEGFPVDFCPYPCLQRFEGCDQETHVCTEPCHSGAHAECTYPSAVRLKCGHANTSRCNEEPDCGRSRTIELPCSHSEVVGWDSVLLKLRYADVKHSVVLKCGESEDNVKCDAPTVIVCPKCGADRKVKCSHRTAGDDGTYTVNEDLDGSCPHCHTLYQAIWKSIRDKEVSKREQLRASKERESYQLRMEQVEAAKKGIFVEGQRVWVSDVSCVDDPERYLSVFGDRKYTTEVFPVGKQGTVRARTNHPDDVGTLVYLIETQGQEFFICMGSGLQLHNVVSELQTTSKNVLLITAGAAPDLEVGQWRSYARDSHHDSGLFDVAPFAEVQEVRDRGVQNFYNPADPPHRGELFLVEARLKHPDGSNVTVYLLRNIARGSAQHFALAVQAVFKGQPYQKGQRVLIATPQRLIPSAGFHRHFPEAQRWFDGPVHANDSGMIVGIINDCSDAQSFHYIIRLDVRQEHVVMSYKGVELDEEAERMKREDSILLHTVSQLADDDWDREQETARQAYARQREADARYKEESKSTQAALLARKKKQEEKVVMTAAERARREQELSRQREDSQRKRKRLDREEEDRTATDVEEMKRRREKKVAAVPEAWAEPEGLPEGAAVKTAAPTQTRQQVVASLPSYQAPPAAAAAPTHYTPVAVPAAVPPYGGYAQPGYAGYQQPQAAHHHHHHHHHHHPHGGYPQQHPQVPGGYPAYGGAPGYAAPGYPPVAPGYPQQGYPQQPGYPPYQGGYR